MDSEKILKPNDRVSDDAAFGVSSVAPIEIPKHTDGDKRQDGVFDVQGRDDAVALKPKEPIQQRGHCIPLYPYRHAAVSAALPKASLGEAGPARET